MSGLPQGWARTRIDSVTTKVAQKIPEGEVRFTYIDIGSVSRETKQITDPVEMLGKDAPSRARQLVKTGDVLVSMTRPNLNAVAMVPDALDGQIASTGFDVLRPDSVEPRWLFSAVRTAGFVQAMTDLVQGALYPAVRPRDIRGYEIPLAPLPEQTRIADKLDALLARVDAARERLARVPTLLKRFRQSVLAAATSGELTEDWRGGAEAEWEEVALSEVIAPNRPLCYGVVQPGAEDAGGASLIRVQDMQDGRVLVDELRTIAASVDHDFRRSRVEAGDLLVSVVGTIGRTAIVPAGLNANIARAVARIACKDGIDSRWVRAWLSTDDMQWWLINSSKEVARKTLNLSDLSTAPIKLPPPHEQTEIIRRVEALFALADQVQARYDAARARVDKLTPALLAKAFRGELVPQDPNDEPASVLLERLRTSKASEATPAKRGRKPSTAAAKARKPR